MGGGNRTAVTVRLAITPGSENNVNHAFVSQVALAALLKDCNGRRNWPTLRRMRWDAIMENEPAPPP